MLIHVLVIVLFLLSHTLLEYYGRPFSLSRLIKAKLVGFAHKVRQFIIISLLVSRLLKQL